MLPSFATTVFLIWPYVGTASRNLISLQYTNTSFVKLPMNRGMNHFRKEFRHWVLTNIKKRVFTKRGKGLSFVWRGRNSRLINNKYNIQRETRSYELEIYLQSGLDLSTNMILDFTRTSKSIWTTEYKAIYMYL